MDRRDFLASGLATGAMFAGLGNVASLRGNPASLDLEIIREAIAIHPGAVRYQSPQRLADMHRAFEGTYSSASSLEARYLIMSRFLASLRCGRTYCNFYSQSGAVTQDLLRRPTRLPFLFRWIDDRMIVTANGAEVLERGSEILSIDGRDAADVFHAMLPFARADGGL